MKPFHFPSLTNTPIIIIHGNLLGNFKPHHDHHYHLAPNNPLPDVQVLALRFVLCFRFLHYHCIHYPLYCVMSPLGLLDFHASSIEFIFAHHCLVTVVTSPAGVLDLITYSSTNSNSSSDPPTLEHAPSAPVTSLFMHSFDSSETFRDSIVSGSLERPPSQVPYKEIPLGRPYHTQPDGVLKMLTARKRVHPYHACVPTNRRRFYSSPSSLPCKRHRSSSSSSSSDSPSATTIRFRSSLAVLSIEASIKEIIELGSEEEDIDFDIIADIKADIAIEAATAAEIRTETDVGFEGDDEAKEEAESSTRGTVETDGRSSGVTVVTSPAGVLDLITYSSTDSDSSSDPPILEHASSAPVTSLFMHSFDSSETFRDSIVSGSLERPPSQEIPLGQPYHTQPDGVLKMLTARKRVHPYHACVPTNRTRFYSSPSSSPRKRHRSSSSSSSSDSPSATTIVTLAATTTVDNSPTRPSHKRCRSLTTSLPLTIPAPGALSLVRADLLPPRRDIKADIAIEAATAAEIRTETDVGVLKGSNMRLRGDLAEERERERERETERERVRDDSIGRRLSYVQEELR
uniref:Uncharacterized protein n=1 Tax=Tanacetum cinerariifolium TaxID=118510 RepID=A0A6L2KDB2_TANCI|nr:hypothetical protein [Tanacetum cinerariifolium]